MTDGTLRQALACASRGWPVFPCQPGQKIPATRHGHRDATGQEQITAWFSRGPAWNLAIATGTPGPDVLDVDQHGKAGNGFAALERLRRAGLLDGASSCVRTPGGGLHIYFTGSCQHNGHLAGQHVDFRSEGGYILARRALEADPAADLGPLAGAARQAGLAEPEIRPELTQSIHPADHIADHEMELE